MPKSRDDPRNDLTILMLADQHVGSRSTIACRDHQLLRVPKGEDDVPTLTIQGIHLLMALRIHPHRPPQPSNHRRSDRREQRELRPLFKSLHHNLRIRHILELHRMEPLILSATAKQLLMRTHLDDRSSGQHHDSIGLLNG